MDNEYLKMYGDYSNQFVNIQLIEFDKADKKYLVEWYVNENDYSNDQDFYTYKDDALEAFNEMKNKIKEVKS
jgi:hypothetical protein